MWSGAVVGLFLEAVCGCGVAVVHNLEPGQEEVAVRGL